MSATFKCSRCSWTGTRATAAESLETHDTDDGIEQVGGIMCPKCSSPLDPISPLPDREIVAKAFADVLLAWSKDEPGVWEKMLADNAAENDKNICHSHDWCDANMAMDEAMRGLGIDHSERWGDDWASNDEASKFWGDCWDIAKTKFLTARKADACPVS